MSSNSNKLKILNNKIFFNRQDDVIILNDNYYIQNEFLYYTDGKNSEKTAKLFARDPELIETNDNLEIKYNNHCVIVNTKYPSIEYVEIFCENNLHYNYSLELNTNKIFDREQDCRSILKYENEDFFALKSINGINEEYLLYIFDLNFIIQTKDKSEIDNIIKNHYKNELFFAEYDRIC